MESTKEIFDRHLACFGKGDLKGLLADYAPDAVMFTTGGVLKGPESMRPLFAGMLAEFGKQGVTFSMQQVSVEGDYAYMCWTAETPDNVYEFATDTLVIRGGKILAHSFSGKIVRK